MKVDDIVERLSGLGIDRTLAEAYVKLVVIGRCKASDLAVSLGIHRSEAYRVLQRLVNDGLATATLERPQRFEAAPPEQLFEQMVRLQQSRLEAAERARESVSSALTRLHRADADDVGRSSYKLVQGRPETYTVLERMMRGAREELVAVTANPAAGALADAAGLLDLAVERAREGVTVRAAVRTTPQMRARAAPILAVPGVEIRHVELDRVLRFVVADGAEVVFWVVSDPSERLTAREDVALWTDAPDFVAAMTLLHDRLWEDGVDLRHLAGDVLPPPAPDAAF